jgi:hypothetical protein
MKRISKSLLFLFTILITSCSQPTLDLWTTACVDQGRHAYKPGIWNTGEDVVAYEWLFTEESRYELPGVDQQDWNKLTGISFNLLNSRKWSFMVGWRYNLDLDSMELTPYYHLEANRYSVDWGDPEGNQIWKGEPLRVGIDEIFSTRITVDEQGSEGWVYLEVITSQTSRTHEWNFGEVVQGSRREINAWFGGNRTAPADLCLHRKRIN